MMQKIHIVLFVSMLISFAACKPFATIQQKGLYENTTSADENSIDGFNAVYIFKDDFDKSVWVSPETQCVTMQTDDKHVYADKNALHVKWDKIKGGCKWIGIGFGWNNWVAKDMLDLTENCAVQMHLKIMVVYKLIMVTKKLYLLENLMIVLGQV
jgi:hypothetical protein